MSMIEIYGYLNTPNKSETHAGVGFGESRAARAF